MQKRMRKKQKDEDEQDDFFVHVPKVYMTYTHDMYSDVDEIVHVCVYKDV